VGISSLLLNLLINAYKYTGARKRIRVALKELDGAVELSVEDNGIGISRALVARIFEPFYRVDSKLRGKAPGVGLGLAIVRHHARAHSGEVYVESEEGVGSRFAVRLPIAAGQKDEGR
jgi:signal transduction histidine kinase